MGVIGQIFTSIAGKLNQLWNNIRTSAKSIYNGIHSYIKGEITNTRDLLKVILKSLTAAMWVPAVLALEAKLETILPFGIFLAPIFAVVAGAFAVVITARSIDLAIDTLFGVYAAAAKSKARAEDIANLIAEKLPAIIEKREALQKIIAKTHKDRILSLESSFSDYQNALDSNNDALVTTALTSINKLYNKELKIKNMQDVKAILQTTNRSGSLTW